MNKMKEEDIYKELLSLREEIKLRQSIAQSKIPRVCDDNALKLLAHYRPKTKEDMMKISGLGEKFDLEYSEIFLKKLSELNAESIYNFTQNDINTLKKLENRLVNISQNNRLLYSGKINKNFGLDILDILNLNEAETLKNNILNRSNASFNLTKIDNLEDKKLKDILKLIRTSEKLETETGSNDLYIAYPFAEGKSENEDFLFKAPLLLFPIKIMRNGDNISLRNDNDRDIIYNTTLILANNKFNGKNEVLPDSAVEEFNQDTYIYDMLKFYEDNKLSIQKTEFNIEKFLENRKSEFPNYNRGQIQIKGYMTIGLYTSYISSMYSDFQSLIDSKIGTKLIADLLWGLESPEKQDNRNIVTDINNLEENIYYINEVDSSQENVLKNVKEGKSLVIQGPPGTGKSQTITSVIAEKILEGKNVLMVSEKKTALDVIYSRLGILSDFGIILDDAQNKTEFYSQVEKLMGLINNKNLMESSLKNERELKEEIESISKKIEDLIMHLTEISNTIYEENEFGSSLYNLYLKCQKYDLKNIETLNKYTKIKAIYPEYFNNIKYQTFEECHKIFETNDREYNRYLQINNKYKNYTKIKENLSSSEIELFKQETKDFINQIEQLNHQNIIKKLLNRNKIIKRYQTTLNKIFNLKTSKDNEEIVNNIIKNNNIDEFIDIYNEYQDLKYKQSSLNEPQRKYLEFINDIINNINITFKEANDEIIRYTYNIQIEKHEKTNPKIKRYINNFEEIRKEIKKYISEKTNKTKELSYNTLLNNLKLFDKNGKFNKIEEAVSKKRKPSITKFMDRYSLELMDSIKIWLMTPEVVSDILPFVRDMFDLVIFDEASQLYLEKAIPAVYRGNKILVAGDKKQLKPSSLGKGRVLDVIEDDLEDETTILEYESLLEAAEYKFQRVMLKYHYRSIYSELIDFSNYAFYKGELLALTSAEAPKTTPIERFIFEEGRWNDRQNEVEAKEVVKLVKKIFNEKEPKETVGVITFNTSQMDLIEDELEKERYIDQKFNLILSKEQNRIENGENKSFFVKNIETVQGDERDIIIFCIGYAKNETGKVSINFGWLNQDVGENRLNVAISRSKKKIYVITSIEPEELIVNDTKNEGPKLFKKYLEYVKAVSNNSKEEINVILDNLTIKENSEITNKANIFENYITEKITENNYNIIKNYGSGGFKIDMVVQNSEGKNILAIEFDGNIYESIKETRKRDYHHIKYLEARGWNTYRIWTPNFWNNKEEEINKLLDYIKQIEER